MLSAGRRTAGQGRGRRAGCGLGERPHGGGRVEHVRMGVGVVVSEAGVSERAALERVGEAAERVAQRRCPRACGERPPPRTGSRRGRTSAPSPRERRPWRPSLQTPPGTGGELWAVFRPKALEGDEALGRCSQRLWDRQRARR